MAMRIACSWKSGTPERLAEHPFEFVGRPVLGRGLRVEDRLQPPLAAQVRMHHVALDRAGPDDRHLHDEVVEAGRAGAAAACSSAPGSRPGTRRGCRRAGASRRSWGSRAGGEARSRSGPPFSRSRSRARRRQVSMPSPSTSTLRMPSASMSSLSHSSTVRPSIAALPTTASSTSGPRVMTKPPTWVARWRGKPWSSSASCSAIAKRPSGRPSPSPSAISASDRSPPGPQDALASLAVTSSDRPIALPTSRTALRVRKRITVAAMAARSRP